MTMIRMTFSRKAVVRKTFNKIMFSEMNFSRIKFSKITVRRWHSTEFQENGIRHNDTMSPAELVKAITLAKQLKLAEC